MGLIQSSSRKLYLILSMKRWDWSLLFKRDIFNGNITFSVFSDKKHLSLREKGIGEQCGGGWLLSLRNEVQTQPNMFANYSKEKKVGGGNKTKWQYVFFVVFCFLQPKLPGKWRRNPAIVTFWIINDDKKKQNIKSEFNAWNQNKRFRLQLDTIEISIKKKSCLWMSLVYIIA